ncbi:hypothetical protein BGE01nite_19040 [Brevifollis gellanilyticus]|uniref:Uncharacterized protein n=1 Tax=Brevifollis gellanilyticus TaxID=748831 RepID=A0A512M7C4_9BACT|nr:hypothetical protein BGE01nite_19040 [Brevifollis gellanilyticus]
MDVEEADPNGEDPMNWGLTLDAPQRAMTAAPAQKFTESGKYITSSKKVIWSISASLNTEFLLTKTDSLPFSDPIIIATYKA